MATVVFPAYGLARLAVRPGWALFAAAGAGISPALAYAPILVKEPTAYPASTLALFLVARWAAKPTARGLLLAAAGCGLGVVAKEQLVVLFPILGLSALAVIWRGNRMSAFRRTWTPGDWIGAATLTVGAVLLAGAYASQRSTSWYVATTFFQDRMLEYGLWAAGALSIGLGLIPLIAGLASIVRPKGEEVRTRCRGTRDRYGRLDRLLRPLYGGQGRLPVDRVRNADARAQPDLRLAPPLRGNRALPAATRRTLVGRRRGRVLCALPRPLDAVLAGAVPQLRGARPRDRRVRKPHPPVARQRISSTL